MQCLLLHELIGGVIDEMEDVDEYLQRDDELIHGKADLIGWHFYFFLGGAAVPFVAQHALYLQEDVSVLLVVACYQVGCAVGCQAVLADCLVGFCFADVEVVAVVCWTDLAYYRSKALDARVEDRPVRETKGFDKLKGLTFVQILVPFIQFRPGLDDDMRPRLFLQKWMSSDLLPSLIIVHKIIDDDLSDSPVLHNSNMVKPLLTDSLRLDEGQEVPLWQHPHLGDETRLAQK